MSQYCLLFFRENDNESFFLQLRLKQLDIMHRNKTRLLTDWLDRVTCVCVDPQSDQVIMKLNILKGQVS